MGCGHGRVFQAEAGSEPARRGCDNPGGAASLFIVSADGKIAAGLLLVAAVTFGYFTGGAGWNQDAHFDLTRAIVERHTLSIDRYDVNTRDVSKGTRGHHHLQKPPGPSILGTPPSVVSVPGEPTADAPGRS